MPESMWAVLALCVTMCGLIFMGLKPDNISRLGEEYEAGLIASTEAARAARMTFEDTGHRPSARKVDDLTKLGWIDFEDDSLARRLQEQEVRSDGDDDGKEKTLVAACVALPVLSVRWFFFFKGGENMRSLFIK